MDTIRLILFHTGKLPSYLKDTLQQIRLFNPDIDVYFLTDKENMNNALFQAYRIIPMNKDTFHSEKVDQFIRVFGRKVTDFWTITAIRIIYIENLINKFKWTNVYHFENDVLIYYPLIKHHSLMKKLYKNLAITTGGKDKCMTGFMFIQNGDALSRMTQFWIDLLVSHTKKEIMENCEVDMINEMTLMRIYQYSKRELNKLPTIPFESLTENLTEFNSIFDPASWGQFVGGTQSEPPGAMPEDHYIGQLLRSHPSWQVIWKKDNEDRKVPYFKFSDLEVKINNLHIHSKNLHLYTS